MHKCRHPEHPHCTHWVLEDTGTCAGGHAQPADHEAASGPASTSPQAPSALVAAAPAGLPVPGDEGQGSAGQRFERRGQGGAQAHPILHVSGFDPRAAGGRQALRLELRAMPPDVAPRLEMHLTSALFATGPLHRDFTRTRHGEWPPAVIEFASRGREHGQYPIEVELLAHRNGAPPRRWTCTVVVLIPRPDATLTEIHQTFLATHRNVRVSADDASIARVGAQTGGGRLDIDVTATNASIAQLNLDTTGKADLALPTIAWDQELIETGTASGGHPQPVQAACLVNSAPAAGSVRHIRLFAFDECVLGRLDGLAPIADILLAHHGLHGPDSGGLTRRLSARHAIVRRGLHGFEIEDISRYGLLIDGAWPGKHVPVALRPGMRIELTASVRNIVTLGVSAVLPHGIVLHRTDAGASAECFYLIAPDRQPGPGVTGSAGVPIIFHANGGFWQRDPRTMRDTPLRLAPTAYPELQPDRTPARSRVPARAPALAAPL